MYSSIFPSRGHRALALAVIAASFPGATQAQDIGQLEAQMRKAVEDASARRGAPALAPAAASSSAKNEPAQNVRSIDVDLAVFIAVADSVVSCSSGKPVFKQQHEPAIQKSVQMLRYARQLQLNPTLKAQTAVALAAVLQAALPLTRILDSACLNSASTTSAAAPGAKPSAVASAAGQPTAATRYELVAAVMRQVFNAGDLRPQSRAVKYAADVDMPARGGTPATLYAYLTAQNGVAKAWYKANFGLLFPDAEVAAGATVLAGSAESPQNAALNDAAMDLGKTREPLPALPETAALVNQVRQFSDNLGQVVSAMKSGGGFDDAGTAQLAGIVEALRYLASGSPFSLQNLAGGGAVALTPQELQQVDELVAASSAARDMRRMNTALLDAVREVQPQAVNWKEWPHSPRIQLAAMGELPLNLPAFTEFGRETLNLSTLDRGQRLVMVLKIANSLKKVSVFSEESLSLDTNINGVLDGIQQAMGIDPKKTGKDGALQVMSLEKSREFMKASGKYLKVVSIATLTTKWIQTLSRLAGSLIPDTIVGFHAQTGKSRTSSTWDMKKDAVVGLSLYVVPQVSGGGNALTPHGLAARAVDAVKSPFLGRITGELGKRLESTTMDYLRTFVQMQAQQMLARINVSSGPLFIWTMSQRDTFPIAARSLEPVEINDRRLVNMSVVPADAPEIALDNPGNFSIAGKRGGNVILRSYIHNADLLRYVKASPYLAMSVTVVDDTPPKRLPSASAAASTPKAKN